MFTIIGIILIFISVTGICISWRANEWRQPLLEISGILEQTEKPEIAEIYLTSKKRGTICMVFHLVLYLLGAIFLYIKYPFLWIFVLEIIVLLWLAKGVIDLIKAGYSRKVKLLNYLYSPYFLAWRRDRWKSYNDKQIAIAVCKVVGVDINKMSVADKTLDEFLIELCKHTRPEYESEQYSNALKDLHKQADEMIWS